MTLSATDFYFVLRRQFNSAAAAVCEWAEAHHFNGHAAEVRLSDRRVVTLHHVDALARERLNDGQVRLQRSHLVTLEDEAADAAVEFTREQQADHRRLDVLLLVLVRVEGVPQVLWDVV